MLKFKALFLGSLLFFAFIAAGNLNSGSGENPLPKQADGTAPPAPPIPWIAPGQNLSADGTAPPAPPIPWRYASLAA